VREDLRREKQWQLADKIRNSLVDAGVIIEDNPGGTIWKYK
jgi:cysteinyl-tRNA synthetase